MRGAVHRDVPCDARVGTGVALREVGGVKDGRPVGPGALQQLHQVKQHVPPAVRVIVVEPACVSGAWYVGSRVRVPFDYERELLVARRAPLLHAVRVIGDHVVRELRKLEHRVDDLVRLRRVRLQRRPCKPRGRDMGKNRSTSANCIMPIMTGYLGVWDVSAQPFGAQSMLAGGSPSPKLARFGPDPAVHALVGNDVVQETLDLALETVVVEHERVGDHAVEPVAPTCALPLSTAVHLRAHVV